MSESAINVKINIKNLSEIQAAFRRAPMAVTQQLTYAIGRIASRIEATAKRNAPVNKQSGGGNLRQSIRSQVLGPARGIVEVTASYAAAVHEGTRPHVIKIANRKVLANKRSGQFFGKVVHHPGTRPQPFLQQAVDQEQNFIDSELENAVERALK